MASFWGPPFIRSLFGVPVWWLELLGSEPAGPSAGKNLGRHRTVGKRLQYFSGTISYTWVVFVQDLHFQFDDVLRGKSLSEIRFKTKNTTIHHSKAVLQVIQVATFLTLPVGGHQHPTNPANRVASWNSPQKGHVNSPNWKVAKVKNFEKQMKVQLGVEGVSLRPEAALSRILTLSWN